MACGIELNGKFIVTGGYDNGGGIQTVAEFTVSGQVTYLANLQTGRYNHACSKFVDENGETVSFNCQLQHVVLKHHFCRFCL